MIGTSFDLCRTCTNFPDTVMSRRGLLGVEMSLLGGCNTFERRNKRDFCQYLTEVCGLHTVPQGASPCLHLHAFEQPRHGDLLGVGIQFSRTSMAGGAYRSTTFSTLVFTDCMYR